MQNFMEWAGCAFGVAGSLALALKVKRSGWGFVLYLVSNGAWLAFGLATGVYGLALQHAAFTATSALGVWRWLLSPWLRMDKLTVYSGSIWTPGGERLAFDFVADASATRDVCDAEAFRAIVAACERGDYAAIGSIKR
jgi:hypothetical protein